MTSYAIYFGTSPTTKLDGPPIATLQANGTDLQYELAHEAYPQGATHLLAFSVNGAGVMPTGVAIALSELEQGVFADISAAQPTASGIDPTALLDEAAGKLLVVTKNMADSGKPALFRCNLDGTGCTYADLSAGLPAIKGHGRAAVLDLVNGKLLVAGSVVDHEALFRCELDGSACTHTDLTAGGPQASFGKAVLMDATANKLLVVGAGSLRRCELDGSGCTFADISCGQAVGNMPSAVIDATNGKLLVATTVDTDPAQPGRLGLLRCNLDGTACTFADISAGQGKYCGGEPSLVIDVVNSKLLVATMNGLSPGAPPKLSLFRCDLDGSACTHTDITQQTGIYGYEPFAMIDGGKLLVVAFFKDDKHDGKTALIRCDLDGSACTPTVVSPPQGPGGGTFPAAVIDGARRTLLITAPIIPYGGCGKPPPPDCGKPALFTVCLR